jgi:hypothetical protein
LTALELLETATLLQQLAEQTRQSGSAVSPELKATWSDLERRLLLGLRAEERAASPAGTNPLRELKAIGANERLRNLVWEVSVAFELQTPRPGAMFKLSEALRARACAHPVEPRMHPAA